MRLEPKKAASVLRRYNVGTVSVFLRVGGTTLVPWHIAPPTIPQDQRPASASIAFLDFCARSVADFN